MVAQDRLYTAQDLWTLSEEGQHYELFKGTLSEMSPTGSAHGHITAELTYLIMAFARLNDLGTAYGAETGFILAQDTVLAPDTAFTAKADLVQPVKGLRPQYPILWWRSLQRTIRRLNCTIRLSHSLRLAFSWSGLSTRSRKR